MKNCLLIIDRLITYPPNSREHTTSTQQYVWFQYYNIIISKCS